MDLAAYLLLAFLLLGSPVSGAPLLAEAKTQFDAGHYADAAEVLRRYLDVVPEDGDARVLLGWCQYRQGEFTAAASTFSAALERLPTLDDARVGLGYASLQSGGFEASVEQFRSVLTRSPHHRDAMRGLVLAGLRDAGIAISKKPRQLPRSSSPRILPTGMRPSCCCDTTPRGEVRGETTTCREYEAAAPESSLAPGSYGIAIIDPAVPAASRQDIDRILSDGPVLEIREFRVIPPPTGPMPRPGEPT